MTWLVVVSGGIYGTDQSGYTAFSSLLAQFCSALALHEKGGVLRDVNIALDVHTSAEFFVQTYLTYKTNICTCTWEIPMGN